MEPREGGSMCLLAVLTSLLAVVHGFSTGAGPTACADMIPKHFALRPRFPPTPIYVDFELSQNEYRPGDSIKLTLRSQGESNTFKGFLVQARLENPKEHDRWFGTFQYDEGSTRTACSWQDESGETHNAITHTAPGKAQAIPRSEQSLTWTAPKKSVGNIVFNITIVHSYWTVWVGYSTQVVLALDDPETSGQNMGSGEEPSTPSSSQRPFDDGEENVTTPTVAPSPTVEGRPAETDPNDSHAGPEGPGPNDQEVPEGRSPEPCFWQPVEKEFGAISVKDCGVDYSCFRWPPGCEEPFCEVLLTWRDQGTHVNFEVSARTSGWVAVGFSHDKLMGDDSVTTCTYRPGISVNNQQTGGEVCVVNTYNVPNQRVNEIVSDAGLSNKEGYFIRESKDHSLLRCRFSRDKWVLEGREPKIFDLHSRYYIMLASGTTSADGSIERHTTTPKISPVMVKMDMEPIDIHPAETV